MEEYNRDDLETYIRRYVVADCDDAACEAWAEVTDTARRKGRPIGAADAWIAATALVRGFPLVTNNPIDYAGVEGLEILTA